jgi:phospholipase A1
VKTCLRHLAGVLLICVCGSGSAQAEKILNKRIEAERAALDNPYIITQHRSNYFLAYSYMDDPNQAPYEFVNGNLIEQQEAKYQISIKAPIYHYHKHDLQGVYVGVTLQAWWQIYNESISKPFRETNYEPELFYQWVPTYDLGAIDLVGFHLGINHQSNGQSNIDSRSWNRIFASAMFRHEQFFATLKTWYRIPEEEKDDPLDPSGDDNPDIEDFLGKFELELGATYEGINVNAFIRNNLKSDNKGAFELNLTYPISSRFALLLHYFTGYGESLIDYDHHIERIGIGVQLSAF